MVVILAVNKDPISIYRIFSLCLLLNTLYLYSSAASARLLVANLYFFPALAAQPVSQTPLSQSAFVAIPAVFSNIHINTTLFYQPNSQATGQQPQVVATEFDNPTTTSATDASLYRPQQGLARNSKARRKEGRIELFNLWLSSDISRLFSPSLTNDGRLNLYLNYSLKRTPYLLMRYDEITIKAKVSSKGMIKSEILYNLNLSGAQLGVKLRNEEPSLYFRYRFH